MGSFSLHHIPPSLFINDDACRCPPSSPHREAVNFYQRRVPTNDTLSSPGMNVGFPRINQEKTRRSTPTPCVDCSAPE